MKTIFVYGSLKSGKSKNFYLTRSDSKLLGATKTAPNYKLVQQWFQNYPSMIEDEKGVSIEGELWQVSDETLRDLDDIEGVARGLFKRVPIKLHNGSEVEAYLAVEKPFLYWNAGSKW